MSHTQLAKGYCSPEVLNNVVLYKRVASPAVDGKVGVAVGVVGTRVGDGADTWSAKTSHQLSSRLS
jgi:hypothetical protein